MTNDAGSSSPESAPRPAATGRDKLLLGLFWAWALVLVVATLARLFGWTGVLEVLDVKRWFAR